jgi:hypothetical protein
VAGQYQQSIHERTRDLRVYSSSSGNSGSSSRPPAYSPGSPPPPYSVRGSSTASTSGRPFNIAAGQPFAGRAAGGGTRGQVCLFVGPTTWLSSARYMAEVTGEAAWSVLGFSPFFFGPLPSAAATATCAHDLTLIGLADSKLQYYGSGIYGVRRRIGDEDSF